MIHPDQLLHTECEEEREASLLFFIGSLFKQVCKKIWHYRCSWYLGYTYRYSKFYSIQKADRQEDIVMV